MQARMCPYCSSRFYTFFAGCDINKASQCRVEIFRGAKFTNRSQFCAEYIQFLPQSKPAIGIAIVTTFMASWH